MLFQMDNARPHTAAATQHFLACWNVNLVKQSPYSSDLNLLDRFLFRQVKSDLREKIIAAHISFKKGYTAQYLTYLEKLKNHLEDVFTSGGD